MCQFYMDVGDRSRNAPTYEKSQVPILSHSCPHVIGQGIMSWGNLQPCQHRSFPDNVQRIENIIWYPFHEAKSVPQQYWLENRILSGKEVQ